MSRAVHAIARYAAESHRDVGGWANVPAPTLPSGNSLARVCPPRNADTILGEMRGRKVGKCAKGGRIIQKPSVAHFLPTLRSSSNRASYGLSTFGSMFLMFCSASFGRVGNLRCCREANSAAEVLAASA